ncbi:hypothetical protein L3X38_013549 [Prunus dulcis]|uniref:Uncharacterized protein n=1 Tax=Prunus dulcis TaxID=3755 RepID=A0AAD4WNN4_PRUDU|nr:hypothetical protein L3X38_013549 [Prunus dulcis]
MLPWAVEIGKEFGVPLVYLSAFCAPTCVFLTSLENISKANTDHDVLPSPESLTSPRDFGTFRSTIAHRKHEAVDMHAVFYELNDSDGPWDFSIRATAQDLLSWGGYWMEGHVDNYNDMKEIRRLLRQLTKRIICIEDRIPYRFQLDAKRSRINTKQLKILLGFSSIKGLNSRTNSFQLGV